MARGCCGGGRVAPPGETPRAQTLATAQSVQGINSNDLVRVVYTGGMQGGFGIVGQVSGIRYSTRGPGMTILLPDGREGADARDVPFLMRINGGRDFEVQP